jgi:DNA-directed RNA polymerase subunit RPC12/RpoP
MNCGTCGHTLEAIDSPDSRRYFHCPRCGTFVIVQADGMGSIYVPKLVDRCRTLERQWHRLGIAESIRPPEDRAAS